MLGAILMLTKAVTRSQKFLSIGKCIYCGSANGRLTDEHIIPFGLGGRLVFECASCDNCARETHAFEGHCLGGMFLSARTVHKIRSKKRGIISKVPIGIKSEGGERKEMVDIDFHPAQIYMPEISMAGWLFGMRPDEDLRWALSFQNLDENFNRNLRILAANYQGKDVYIAGMIGIVEFGRMLAKIAHSYAVASGAMHGFTPVVVNLVKSKDERYIQQYMWTSIDGDEPSDELHEIDSRVLKHAGRDLLIVRIRLFAFLGMKNHNVIVGASPKVPDLPAA